MPGQSLMCLRRQGLQSSPASAMPAGSVEDAAQLQNALTRAGLTTQQWVVLCGAHYLCRSAACIWPSFVRTSPERQLMSKYAEWQGMPPAGQLLAPVQPAWALRTPSIADAIDGPDGSPPPELAC